MTSRVSVLITLASATVQPASGQQCQWEALAGTTGFDLSGIRALAVYDDGLYVGGTFRASLGGPASFLARWDGESWSGVGSGVGNAVLDLLVFDDGSGPALYAAGGFIRAGGVTANKIARWDGREWSSMANGVFLPGQFGNHAIINALAAFDDGSGSALYAAGSFVEAGGLPAFNIARWDGQSWSPVGEGLVLTGFDADEVTCLAVHDDGTGPALYAGGSIDGAMQRWNGQNWQVVANVAGPASAMLPFDDGTGPMLYAGGNVRLGPALHFGRWDGNAWSSLGSGVDYRIYSLYRYDDGTGPGLYIGGAFSQAGPISTWGVAQWDGQWSALGEGLYNFPFGPSADAMAVYDDGDGPALYVGGDFSAAGGIPVGSIARWKCDVCKADCDRNTTLDVFDFLCFQDAFVTGDPKADCDGNTTLDIFDFLCFQDAFITGCP